MSILQIGIQSRYLQVSPGCRRYISPFLSRQQKQQIYQQKQQTQTKYRQILFQQIKQKQIQKQTKKKKQQEMDLKHEQQFYKKLKKLKPNTKQQINKSRIINGSNNSLINSPPRLITHENNNKPNNYRQNIFKKQQQLSFPSLQSYQHLIASRGLEGLDNKHISLPSTLASNRNLNFNSIQSNYLKNNSLIEIGSKLRDLRSSSIDDYYHKNQQRSSGSRMKYHSLFRNNQNSELKYKSSLKQYPVQVMRQQRHKDISRKLRQKQSEVYDLLQRSTNFIQSTTNPIKQMKKRLKTTPIFLQQDNSDEQDVQYMPKPRPYRIRTQFGTYNFTDYQREESKFYRLPVVVNTPNYTSSLAYSSSDQENSSQRTFTLGQGAKDSIESVGQQENMMKIQQNPEQMEAEEGGNQFYQKEYN